MVCWGVTGHFMSMFYFRTELLSVSIPLSTESKCFCFSPVICKCVHNKNVCVYIVVCRGVCSYVCVYIVVCRGVCSYVCVYIVVCSGVCSTVCVCVCVCV